MLIIKSVHLISIQSWTYLLCDWLILLTPLINQNQQLLGRTRFPALSIGYEYLLRIFVSSLGSSRSCDRYGFDFTKSNCKTNQNIIIRLRHTILIGERCCGNAWSNTLGCKGVYGQLVHMKLFKVYEPHVKMGNCYCYGC